MSKLTIQNHASSQIQPPPQFPCQIVEIIDSLNNFFTTEDFVNIQNKSQQEELMEDVMMKAAVQLTIIPAERIFVGHESDDDEYSVASDFDEIVEIIADAFNRSTIIVDTKLKNLMNAIPVDDIREAHTLKRQHKLH